MTTTETIAQRLKSLPASAQREVLDFVEFLQSRRQEHTVRKDEVAWSAFSLDSAMRGMEDEETPYTLADISKSLSPFCPAPAARGELGRTMRLPDRDGLLDASTLSLEKPVPAPGSPRKALDRLPDLA